jgi:uroporphyrinogen III methyltransferase/synthase
MPVGKVYLVGAGPGDPGLLTLRGKALLEAADCVVYDKLVDPRLLDLTPSHCERLYVGKQAGLAHHCTPQRDINQLLLQKAQQGLRVVRLKGGDPLLFARGAEEVEILSAAGVAYEIIPGVTAALGAAATAAIPLTHRQLASAVTFVTGHEDPAKENCLDWHAVARIPGTLVIYMGLTRMPAIATILIEGGKSPLTPVAYIEWGGTNRQRVITSDLRDAALGSPAGLQSPVLSIVGEVVDLRASLAWFEQRSLFGQRILVPSPPESARRLTDLLEARGAIVTAASAIGIEPAADIPAIDRAQDRLSEFHWLVFTSRPGVEHFLGRLLARNLDLRTLGGIKLAAIGPGTAAALASFHLKADLIPDEYRAEALATSLGPLARGQRVLLVRANRGREVLGAELTRLGAAVETVVAYQQVDYELTDQRVMVQLAEGDFDWVLFSSSNIARSFTRWLSPEMAARVRAQVRLLSISPVTSAVIRELGFVVACEAKNYTLDGMVEALEESVLGTG